MKTRRNTKREPTTGRQGWVATFPDHLRYDRTCLVRGNARRLDAALAEHGAQFLDTFDAVVMLSHLDTQAIQVGTEKERAYTERALGTLRLLLPDPEVVWLRRGAVADELLAKWGEERARGGDERLALLRALFRVRPLVWWLPPRGTG